MNDRVELENNDAVNKTRFRCRCSRTELLQKLEYLSHAVMKKASLPILEGVLLSAESDRLYMTGYDLEFGIRTFVEADDTENGSIVVQLKLFAEMLRSLTEDELILAEDAENMIVIRCGKAACKLAGKSVKDFPVLPAVTGTQQFSLPATQLVDMIHQTIFAVIGNHTSASESVLFDLNHGELSIVACDGVRMAVQREPIHCEMKDLIMVSTETLKKFQKLFAKMKGELTFEYDRRQSANAQILVGDLQIIFKLASGNIIDYKRFFSFANRSNTVIAVKDLLTVLKRCSLLRDKKKLHRVQLRIRKGEVVITCHSDTGSVEDIIPCEYTGEEVAVEFDITQFLSIVKECRTEKIAMAAHDRIQPVCLLPVGDEKRWFLIAPMRPRR